MLSHQLSAPLHLSLGTLSGEVAHAIKHADPAVNPRLTLEQLLELPQPPVEVLKLVKRFAKMCRKDRENPLPSEIVMLLYYTSLAAAVVKLRKPISNLPPVALLKGMKWLTTQTWLTVRTRTLLEEGVRELKGT
jgi:hypothetical protein